MKETAKMNEEQKKFVMDNYKLPHFVMFKKFPQYFPGSYEYEDLVQQGYLGLCKASLNYKESMGKASTYLFNYIWGYINTYKNTKTGWYLRQRSKDGEYGGYLRTEYDSLDKLINIDNGDGEIYDIVGEEDFNYEFTDVVISLIPIFEAVNMKYGRKILMLKHEGYTEPEISDILKIGQPTVNKTIRLSCKAYESACVYDWNDPNTTVTYLLERGLNDSQISRLLNIDKKEVKDVRNSRKKQHI